MLGYVGIYTSSYTASDSKILESPPLLRIKTKTAHGGPCTEQTSLSISKRVAVKIGPKPV